MAISGLAILLSPVPDLCASALAALADHSELELGPRAGDRIAAVLDTPDARQDRVAVEALAAIPGVLRVDLVCVYFDDALDPGSSAPAGANHE